MHEMSIAQGLAEIVHEEKVSIKTGHGLHDWFEWLRRALSGRKTPVSRDVHRS
jgi:hypothetical protein